MRFAESEKGIKTVNRIAVHKTKVIPIYHLRIFILRYTNVLIIIIIIIIKTIRFCLC